MGALHATRYASLRPEKVSTLIHADIEPCPPEWNKKYLLNLYEELPAFYETVDQYVSELRKNSPYAEENLLYDMASHALVQGEDGRFRCRFDRETLSHFDNYDLRPCLRHIQCPSLVIRGKESRVMTEPIAREMSQTIPRCTFVEIQKAAHPVLTDNPTEFLRAISNFLGQLFVRNQ
jgi:non-heme chloroperoxidase